MALPKIDAARRGADEGHPAQHLPLVSPLVAGYVIDVTGNWYLPFIGSMGLLLLGAFSAFLMHPERPFEEPRSSPPISAKAVAAE